MSITFVAAANDYNNTFDCPKPAGVAVGDLLIGVSYQGAGPTPSAAFGDAIWTRVLAIADSTSSGAGSLYIGTRIVDGSEAARLDLPHSTSFFWNVAVLAYRPSATLRVAAEAHTSYLGASAKVTNFVAPSLTALAGDTEVAGYFTANGVSITTQPGTDRSQRVNPGNSGVDMVDVSGLGAGATGTLTEVMTTSDWGFAVALLLTEAGLPASLVYNDRRVRRNSLLRR
jgi:hypothetical protein